MTLRPDQTECLSPGSGYRVYLPIHIAPGREQSRELAAAVCAWALANSGDYETDIDVIDEISSRARARRTAARHQRVSGGVTRPSRYEATNACACNQLRPHQNV